MSLWSFLGGFFVFNAVCDMFSSKRKPVIPEPEPYYRRRDYADYPECDIDGVTDTDIDVLQEHIYELEDRLDDCDVMSDRYDEIQDRIDMLQDRLDEMEDRRDSYECYQEDLEDLSDELDDIAFGSDIYDDINDDVW